MKHVLAAGTNTDVIARETLFWILAVASVGAALAMILVRRAVHCAMMLAVVMLSLATMYAMQGAPFLAFVQIIVYTGAVLMLFLFVLMLIGISSADSIVETIKGQRLAAGLRRDRPAGDPDPRHRARGHRPGGAHHRGERDEQPLRDRHPDLHHLRVPVRGHRRAAHHRGARGDGARAPRAHGTQAHAAGPRRQAAGQRPAGAGPFPWRLRAARRRGPAGPAAGRHAVRSVGQPGAVSA